MFFSAFRTQKLKDSIFLHRNEEYLWQEKSEVNKWIASKVTRVDEIIWLETLFNEMWTFSLYWKQMHCDKIDTQISAFFLFIYTFWCSMLNDKTIRPDVKWILREKIFFTEVY